MSAKESEFGGDLISIVDDNGEEFEVEVIDYMDYDGETFGAFLPAYMDENDPDYGLIILRVVPDENGFDTFESIDDEDRLNEVFEAFARILYDGEEDGEE